MHRIPDASRRRGAAADEGLGIEGPRDLENLHRFSHEAMATVFEIHAVHPDERYAAQAAHEAFVLLDRLEAELSRFRSNSDITRINQLTAGESTRIGVSALECLLIARHLFDLTGGAFDISIGSGLPTIDLDPDLGIARATTDGVQVDLGGIGKGYAVDRMAEVLEEWGMGTALVHGGFSSMLALDAPGEHGGWPLTLSDPLIPSRVLVRLSARQMVLAASGLQKGAHILDPRSGQPAGGRVAAWVALPRPEAARRRAPDEGPRVAPSAVADALTTAFMLLHPEEIGAICERSPGLQAWILEEGGAGPTHFGAGGSDRTVILR